MIKILHTSDWHLGKKLFRLDRSLEHELFLNNLIEIIINQDIDLLLIAGDIFDTPTPPHQSLEMFYDFLHTLGTKTIVTTYIIAGNHDSGVLLEAPKNILANFRVKIWGKLSSNQLNHWVTYQKENQAIEICAIPFFRTFELESENNQDILTAFSKYLENPSINKKILLLHHLAGIYEAAGSEQVISLSGVDSIPIDLLNQFDYVALGHIHKPQRIAPHIYYSGSPIPLRFSETKRKSINIISITNNNFDIKIQELNIYRHFFNIKTTLENWKKDIESIEYSGDLTAMAEVQITLDRPENGLVEEIKLKLEDKNIELLSFIPNFKKIDGQDLHRDDIFKLTPTELFESFYHYKFPAAKDIPLEIKQDFLELLSRSKNAP